MMRAWQVMTEPDGCDYHVVPLIDLRDHALVGTCWCRPVEDVEAVRVWIHNAMDQRERYETGELLPQ